MLAELQKKAKQRKEAEELAERMKAARDRVRNPEPEVKRPYTAEDAQVAREIMQSKDYYAMMGVSRNCTEAELKKAYKKKAIKLHPDKNAAPQAEEAFKKINAAMACLSDPEKKRVYDQVGNEEAFVRRESETGGGGGHGAGPRFRRRGGPNFEEEFVSPEEFFNYMFFGH